MIRTITLTPSLILLAALAGLQTGVAQEKLSSAEPEARFECG